MPIEKGQIGPVGSMAGSASGQCRDCAHWWFTRRIMLDSYPRDTPEDRWYLDGVCNRLKRSLTITASGGWDGATVDSVETDANFGCVLFEPNGRDEPRAGNALTPKQ